MRIIDFFRFPIGVPSESELFNLEGVSFNEQLSDVVHYSKVTHSMMALFDSQIVYRQNQVKAITKLVVSGDFSFAFMPEVEGVGGEEQIELASQMGCCAVIFHPYLQQISRERYARLQALARHAAERDMIICVCAAYGSRDIYRYYPLEAVVAIAEAVSVPVVITHGGGAKVLDAFLVAETFPHIYLDTSFSLHYWLGSPIEDSFAFAIRRLGANRWMFGSDAPFRPLEDSVEQHLSFCERYGFVAKNVELLMGGAAAGLLGL